MLFHAKPPVAPPPQPTPLKGLRFPCAAAWPCLAANRSNGHGGGDWVENNRKGGGFGSRRIVVYRAKKRDSSGNLPYCAR